jgi:hypothetical protein
MTDATPLPESVIGMTAQVENGHAYLVVTRIETLSDLYAAGRITMAELEDYAGDLEAALPVRIDIGPVANPEPLRANGDAFHISPYLLLDNRNDDISLGSLRPPKRRMPPPGSVESLYGDQKTHFPLLSIPCVNAPSGCDGTMTMKVLTIEHRPHWWNRLRAPYTTTIYFHCHTCQARTDQKSRSETGALIAEGLFALRSWALRGMRQERREP